MQTITPELRQWIIDQAAAGCALPAMLQSMCDAGWSQELAATALETTLETTLKIAQLHRTGESMAPYGQQSVTNHPMAATATRLPQPRLGESPTLLDGGDRRVNVLLAVTQPRITVFGNLLSGEECDALIAAAAPRMQRSLTVASHTAGEEVHVDRTSDGMFFQRGEGPLIERIEARIAQLLQWPVENGEGLQVLHYRPGTQYRPHYDYFDPADAGTPAILQRGGQRVGTLVIYLNTPEKGGGTTFPELQLEVAPQRGNAVFFSYDRPDPATRTLHGGAPVIAGEKWIATKWLRERDFK
ncbi:MAG: 2OG-Fe(II) oxygenase [Burkholderiaceae bacterium]|nr:2OG-Fe(II) oxygenase [Burkholderiaceae bacterium]